MESRVLRSTQAGRTPNGHAEVVDAKLDNEMEPSPACPPHVVDCPGLCTSRSG